MEEGVASGLAVLLCHARVGATTYRMLDWHVVHPVCRAPTRLADDWPIC